jgi:hypothetical protein
MPNDRSRCLSCRALHARCTIDPGQDVCSRCRTLGKSPCIFESVRFKLCKTTTIAAQRTDFLYSPSQSWVPTNLRLDFVFETGDGLENIVKAIDDKSISSANEETRTGEQLSKSHDHKDTAQFGPVNSTDATSDSNWAEPLHTAIELLNRQHVGSPETSNPYEQIMSATPVSPSTTLSLPTTLARETSPTHPKIPLQSLDSDPHSHASCSTDISTSRMQPLTYRETILIHYFISVISPWVRQIMTMRLNNNKTDGPLSLMYSKTYHDLPKKCH